MKNVHYINAGAGAGKTYTLVTILKEILTDKKNPCSPSEIILTTYTKTAAKEFRKKTFERLLEAPAALDVAKILDTATIGTVHSVAQQYIQRYWTELGYSGQFNVMSNIDKDRYINQSIKNFANAGDLEFFYEFTQHFKLTKYDKTRNVPMPYYDFWKDYVLEIVGKMRAYNIPATNLPAFCKQSQDVVDRLFVYNFVEKDFIAFAKPIVDFIDNTIANPGRKKVVTWTKYKTSYTDFIIKKDYYCDALVNFLKSDFFIKEDSLKNELQNAKAYLQKCIALSPANGTKVKDCIQRIFTIAEKWATAFEDYKRQNNLLDFDDLEAKFLELLQKPAVQNDISSSIKYLFVDEFQDSNPIQLEIFQRLSDLVQVKSFWVGDRKQAIYGFRGSDSSLITNLLNTHFATLGTSTDRFKTGLTNEIINISYRSVKSLVEFSNAVFEKSFAQGVPSEIIDKVPLDAYRVQPAVDDGNIKKPVQHWHCDSEDALANKVADILNGTATEFPGVYDDGEIWRTQIKSSDIAVLSRTSADCDKVAEALRKKGIPVSSPETSILDKAEVKLVFALLKYVAGIKRRYAKTELAKLLEEEIVTKDDGSTEIVSKTVGTILQEIANNRYDYNPFFDEQSKEETETTAADEASESTAATSAKGKTVKRDPDNFLADINDKLQGLRGLNVSAIVKGVIAVMDVRNIVAKWGNAAIRQDNLDTLIEQAIAFEQSTANSPESATVTDFLRYMKEVKLESELDQSAEGVKVATYHKSKGLQWPIVILNSLDDDELESKNFVKKNWFGLNLSGTFGSAELQLIPSCVEVNDAVADAVVNLSKAGAGKDDNGYYDLVYGKTEGELKRLLYVGATRPRDYLVTLSLNNKPLKWIENAIGPNYPAALDTIADQNGQTSMDLWNDTAPDPAFSLKAPDAFYEQIHIGTSTYTGTAVAPQKLNAGYKLDATTEPKTLLPSSLHEKLNYTPTVVEDFSSMPITHGTIADDQYDEFGTCIHNYFAAHEWDGKDQVASHKAGNEKLAQTTVSNHGKTKELPQPADITHAADTLFSYLETTFGAGELLRECPFSYCRNNGQLVHGEIDLVWKCANGECILVDYKNYPGTQNHILARGDKHYVGNYFPQLREYRTALEAAGMKVTKVFIFYAVLGCLVEIVER